MKRNIMMIFVICIIFIICTICFINLKEKQNYVNQLIAENEKVDKRTEEQKKIDDINDIVIIELGLIRNENLIDDFIANATYRSSENQELNIIQDNKRIKVTYTSGEYGKYLAEHDDEDDINMDTGDGSAESNRKIYGYYTLYENDKFVAEHVAPTFYVGRMSDKDKNEVNIIFESWAELATPLPVICKYNLDSSNYKHRFDLTFYQRKDLGIKDIYDVGDYKIKTFAGDVTISIPTNTSWSVETAELKTYTLEDALNEKIITENDILEQAKDDEKYNLIWKNYYRDGGSVQYMYHDYNIIKLNTLDGEKDLIISDSHLFLKDYNKMK